MRDYGIIRVKLVLYSTLDGLNDMSDASVAAGCLVI